MYVYFERRQGEKQGVVRRTETRGKEGKEDGRIDIVTQTERESAVILVDQHL